ncbi:LysR substrate-binding domain-containing protein [Hyphococcus formosus]|uniref:LysR substrate-binding domain-containing protein n=1 Tax=Hyphococcus formosus TaxID=3143534 RepID=UPI00398B862A
MDKYSSSMNDPRLPPLSMFLAFEAAARHLSFKLAANELALSPAAISHQIRNLEAQLGVQLFERQVRQVQLTEAGKTLAHFAQAGISELRDGIAALERHSARNRFTITATSTFTALWLTPRLAKLRQENPSIAVRVLASEELINLHTHEADFAFRIFAEKRDQSELDIHWLGQDEMIPVASPNLNIKPDSDFHSLPFIHFEFKNISKHDQNWEKWLRIHKIRRRINEAAADISFSDEFHAYQAAIAGQGVALLSRALVKDAIDRGILTKLSEKSLPGGFMALVRRNESPRQRTEKALWNWLLIEAQTNLSLTND